MESALCSFTPVNEVVRGFEHMESGKCDLCGTRVFCDICIDGGDWSPVRIFSPERAGFISKIVRSLYTIATEVWNLERGLRLIFSGLEITHYKI